MREPGWFMPDEIPEAAAYLNITVKELEERYLLEHEYGGAIILAPRSKPDSSECIFLTRDKRCLIHPVKPYECRKVFGCEAANRHKNIRDIIARRWR